MKNMILGIAIIAFLTISLLAFLNRGDATAETEISYVPGKKCSSCHYKIYKTHSNSAHAMSYQDLVDSGQENNASCLPCHTTGYGKEGGFRDIDSTPNLAGTTCQACHGPGKAHVMKGADKYETISKYPGNACAQCHKAHHEHPNIGADALKKKVKRLQKRIKKMGG